MSKLVALIAVLAIVPLLWVGGELHRQNCERAGKVSCSVLPWDSGEDSGGWGR